RSRLWPMYGLGLAAIAALLLVFLWPRESVQHPNRIALKGGGELIIHVARARAGVVDSEATSFLDGDSFKVVVTCTTPGLVEFAVSVPQGFEGHRPLGNRVSTWCGNNVALPGAFEVTGTAPVEICVTPAEQITAACITLTRASP